MDYHQGNLSSREAAIRVIESRVAYGYRLFPLGDQFDTESIVDGEYVTDSVLRFARTLVLDAVGSVALS